MDENQNSLTDFKIENLHMQELSNHVKQIAIDQINDLHMQELSNCMKQIAIDQINDGSGSSHEPIISCSEDNKLRKIKTYESLHIEFESPQSSSDSLVHWTSDGSSSLDSTKDMENQDAMMLFTDVPSTSTNPGFTKVSKKDILHEVQQQNVDMQAAKNDDSQLTLRYFSGREDKNQNRSYQSYSNLIKICCCQCKMVSKNITDDQCYKCQSPLLFKCIKCSGLYKKYIGIMNHIKYECYNLPTFQCSICIYSTYCKRSLVNHIKKKHSFEKLECAYECSVCKKKFKKQHYMLKHERICDREATLVCQYCPYKTKFNQVLIQHVQRKHQQRMNDNCKNTNCSKKKGSVKKLLKCDHCDFKIYKKFSLVKHIHEMHPYLYKRISL